MTQIAIDGLQTPPQPLTDAQLADLIAEASIEPEPIARCTGCGWELDLWDLTMTQRSSAEYRIEMHVSETGHVVAVYQDYEDADPVMRVTP